MPTARGEARMKRVSAFPRALLLFPLSEAERNRVRGVPFLPPIPTPEQQTEWRERCLDHYVRCKHTVKGEEWGRVFDESQCKACWEFCKRTGVWPDEANGKPCPGG